MVTESVFQKYNAIKGVIALAVKKEAQDKSVEASQKPTVAKKEKLPSIAAQKRKNKTTGANRDKLLCTLHGKEIVTENFYKAHPDSIWKSYTAEGQAYIGVCKDCCRTLFTKYFTLNNNDPIKAMYFTCRRMDVKFDYANAESAYQRVISDGKEAVGMLGYYFGQLNSLHQNTADGNFDASDNIGNSEPEGIEQTISRMKENVKLTSEDKRVQKEIKKRIGFDPFSNYQYNDYDLRQLYMDLLPYLEDDDIIGDGYKLSVILQLINTNHQIRMIDLYISIVNSSYKDFTENMSTISTLTTQKQKLIASNISLVDKNKWLNSQGATARNKLSAMLKYYRELEFEDAFQNYFDELTSEATKTVVDISNRSIQETIHFGENDQKELFQIQRELIQSKDAEIISLREEMRKLAQEFIDYKKKVSKNE